MRAVLWIVLMPSLTAAASPLPPSYVERIRAGNYSEAYSLGEHELAQVEARAPVDARARCAVLDRMARVQLFDYQDPDRVRQEKVLDDARTCRAALPADAARDAHVAWLTLRLDSFKALYGKLGEVKAEAAAAERAFLQGQSHLADIDRAASYHALGSLATSRGDYAAAAARYAEGVAAAGDHDAAARAVRARIQVPIGAMLERLDRHADAIDADRTALEWMTESFGEHSLAEASTYGTLAQTEFLSGHYADALEHAEHGIHDARLQGAHGRRALSFMLTTLGNTLRVTGELARAREVSTEALALERNAPNSSVGTIASRLNQLGYVEELESGCTTAIPRYREALELGEKQFGKDNVRIQVALGNLGGCELKLAHYDAARALFERELHIAEATYGPKHAAVVNSRLSLAAVSLATHAYADAAAALHDALALLPADSLATTGIGAHRALAQALHGLGRDDEAFDEAVRAEAGRQGLLRSVGASLGESNALAFKDNLVGALDLALALAAHDPQPARIAAAWQLEIGARQLVTGLVAARLKAIRQRADAPAERVWRDWEAASHAYAEALLAHEAGKLEASGVTTSGTALEQAERALAHQLGASELPLAASPPDIAALNGALADGAALVAYAIANADPWDDVHPHDDAHAYAFRLERGAPPKLVDLGPSAAIENAVRDWTASLRNPQRDEREVAALGQDVRRLAYDPLALPASSTRLLVVPEGELHRIAWLALPLGSGSWVENGPAVQLLGSERELVETRATTPNPARFVLVGAPAESHGAASVAQCARPLHDLAGAAQEIKALEAQWKALNTHAPIDVLVGRDATKDAVRRYAGGGSLLHFATHAFSGDTPCMSDLLATRGIRLSSSKTAAVPLLTMPALSGLVLEPSHRGAKADPDNGILTAAEVAAMKLDGVDEVTLAACDTGLGPVRPDEGVFGLARAFRVAGARNVVMSLWQVDDAATSALMQGLYRQKIGQHTDTAGALAAASRELLLSRRAGGMSTHPYYWAGFVTAGVAGYH